MLEIKKVGVKMKVIFHIDDLDRWQMAHGNVKNLLEQDTTVEVIVVVNGPAITGYLDKNNLSFIQMNGVKFHACNNAMNSHQITATMLPKEVEVVPAGVYDIVKLQSAGFSYIKP